MFNQPTKRLLNNAATPDWPALFAKLADQAKDSRLKQYYSTEMVNAMWASRVYEANVTVMEMTKSMAAASLRLLA